MSLGCGGDANMWPFAEPNPQTEGQTSADTDDAGPERTDVPAAMPTAPDGISGFTPQQTPGLASGTPCSSHRSRASAVRTKPMTRTKGRRPRARCVCSPRGLEAGPGRERVPEALGTFTGSEVCPWAFYHLPCF